ncbi:MAG: hypothetical protein JWR61_5302 [Ferruginibacter sp.]|nr:hypothetical protein [Ferruginibacter sp.]
MEVKHYKTLLDILTEQRLIYVKQRSIGFDNYTHF